jgi:hypothetical protein
MSFWKRLLGKELTIDEQIYEAGKAAGYPKSIIRDAIEGSERMGFDKKLTLEDFQKQAAQKKK